MLAYLAAQPQHDHARTMLATLLWGDLPESAAKTNLRIELSNLNKFLADHPALVIARNSVCFDRTDAAVDVTDFQAAVTSNCSKAGLPYSWQKMYDSLIKQPNQWHP